MWKARKVNYQWKSLKPSSEDILIYLLVLGYSDSTSDQKAIVYLHIYVFVCVCVSICMCVEASTWTMDQLLPKIALCPSFTEAVSVILSCLLISCLLFILPAWLLGDTAGQKSSNNEENIKVRWNIFALKGMPKWYLNTVVLKFKTMGLELVYGVHSSLIKKRGVMILFHGCFSSN